MGISTASCRGGLRETILIGIIDSHGYRASAPQSGNARPAAAGRSQRVRRARHRARQAPLFIPLTIQFAAQAMRDPLLRRRFAVVLAEARDGGSPDGQLLKALGRVLPAAHAAIS